MYTTGFDQASVGYGGGGDSQSQMTANQQEQNRAVLDTVYRFERFIKYFRRGEQFFYRWVWKRQVEFIYAVVFLFFPC
jgi:hypothetical protein